MLFQFQIQNWLSDVLGVPFLRFEFHAIVYQNHLIDSAHKIFFKNKNKIVVASVLFFIFIIKEKKKKKKRLQKNNIQTDVYFLLVWLDVN